MENNIKGVDKINARIKAEAAEIAEAEVKKAENEAAEILEKAKAASDSKVCDILNDANERASAIMESAKSGAGMRERNALLSLKVEMMEEAFDKAYEKLVALGDEKYISAMSGLLCGTINSFLTDGGKATAYFGDKDVALADKIISEAVKNATVKAEIVNGGKKYSAGAGFVLAIGDTEINCFAHNLINSAKKSLEKPVLDILFPAN